MADSLPGIRCVTGGFFRTIIWLMRRDWCATIWCGLFTKMLCLIWLAGESQNVMIHYNYDNKAYLMPSNVVMTSSTPDPAPSAGPNRGRTLRPSPRAVPAPLRGCGAIEMGGLGLKLAPPLGFNDGSMPDRHLLRCAERLHTRLGSRRIAMSGMEAVSACL